MAYHLVTSDGFNFSAGTLSFWWISFSILGMKWVGLGCELFVFSRFLRTMQDVEAGGGAPPSSRLARRRRGYQVLSYSSKSEYSMNKQQQRRRSSFRNK